MILFFIILAILFFISLFFLLLCLSNLEIQIDKLNLDTNNKKHNKLESYLFYIRLKLLDKITWFKIKIDKEKMKTIENSKIFKSKIFNKVNEYEHIKDILVKNKGEIFKKSNIKYIKELNINFKKLDLYIELCTSNSIFTSFSVVTIASLISISLARSIQKYNKSKYNYTIIPKYEDKLRLKINLNCIIDIKIVHIINVIYMLIKKGRVEYDERTSNRRANVCSNN